jgi:hypothetical protein
MAKFRQTWDTGVCWGAFGAMQDVSRLVDEHGVSILPMGLPEGSTRTQIVTVFVSYVRNHPEQAHLPLPSRRRECVSRSISLPVISDRDVRAAALLIVKRYVSRAERSVAIRPSCLLRVRRASAR